MEALEITTTVGCKVGCYYCPQKIFKKKFLENSGNTQLSLDTFKKCLDKLPKKLEIIFSGFSEPFLNPDCVDMIEYANHKNFNIIIFTSTIGLTRNDLERLKTINIKNITIHLLDKNYFSENEPDNEYFSILDDLIDSFPNVKFLFVRGPLLIETIHPKVENYFKKKKKHITIHTMHPRCGNIEIEGFNLKRIQNKLSPCFRMKRNILLPNGDVALCCMDFGLKHILGNLLENSYESLFEGEDFK